MKFIIYIKENAFFTACIILMIVFTDLVLITSSTIGMGIKDIIYLNVLLAVVICVFEVLGYISFHKKYMKLRQLLDLKENVDYLLPQDSSFHSELLRDVIMAKNEECAQKTVRYQKSMDELNDYITKWVHEIKIPISVFELILDNSDTEENYNSRKMKVELERIRFLINQVLYAGRAAHYNEDLSVTEFNLEKVVKDSIRRNTQIFIMKNIEISTGLLAFNIMNDAKWVSYLLDQILNNAAKYTEQSGKVDIWAQEDDKAVRLYIRDNGIGIVQQDLSRIFDKGFTGENGRKTTKSTGMGLYYSKKMADRLGIGLEAASNPGEYSEFAIVFYKMGGYFKVT